MKYQAFIKKRAWGGGGGRKENIYMIFLKLNEILTSSGSVQTANIL